MKNVTARLLTLILALSLIFASVSCALASGDADDYPVYRVQSQSPKGHTYVYSKPTSSGKLVADYKDGEYVIVFWTEQGIGNTGSRWHYCMGPDGAMGYIRSNNLVFVPNTSFAKSFVVASEHPVGYTYMYSKPTSSGELVGTYYDGTIVKAFYTQQGKGDLSSTWYFCLAPDGALGYIRANNLAEAY